MYEVFRYFQADIPAAKMSPLNVVVETPAPGAIVETVSVPVAVRLAAETLPLKSPLPWTERSCEGEVEPRPRLPDELRFRRYDPLDEATRKMSAVWPATDCISKVDWVVEADSLCM